MIFTLRHVQCWRWGLALCVALGMMLFWQPLTVRSMAVDAVSNDPDIGRASDWPAPLAQEATPPTLSGLYPPRNAITTALTTTITARYNQPMTATSVTSRTFVVHGMQSGVITQVHGLADAYTLAVTPTRAFHQGELVYVIATTGTTNVTGTHPLSSTQWQFNAGVATPRCVAGFSDIAAGLTGARFSHVAWGDYDADGDLDFLLTGWGASGMVSQIYQNTGAGFSQVYPGSLPGVSYSSAAWGDYDADGDLDILLTGYTGGYIARIYQNTGLGFSQVYTGSLPGVYRSSVAWGDYDNDGDLDILLAGDTGSGNISRIYQNTGAGFNQVYAGSLPGVSWGSVAWGDYDNDGDLDILLTGNTGSGTLSRIYQNTGAGFSHDSSVNLPGMSMGAAAWGDYDNDGDLDILLGGGVAQVYQNTGAAFSPVYTSSLTATALGNAAWGDYDNDGDLDILLTGENQSNFNATTQIYRNTGAGFSPVHTGSLLAVEMSSAAWGDYDNDGDLDVLLAGDNNDSLFARVYRNEDCIADLALTKSVTPAVATPGTTLTYTLAFTNGGFGPALGVIITDTLPVSVTNVSVSNNVVITDTGFRPAYVWQVQNLTSGQSGRITIIGVLRNVLPAGVFTNTATIATTGAEAYLDDNEGRASLTVINTAPILEAIGDRIVDELTPLTFTATATDTDIPAQPLTFTLGAGSVGAITPGGVFTWTPTEAQGPGVYMATIQVNDGAQVDSETVSITVREVSQPPTLWPISGQTVAAGAPVRFVAHTTDPDLPAHPLTYTLDAGSVGSITARTGHFTWTASATPGVYTATVRVTDGEWADAETVAITVTEDTPGIGQWVLAANLSVSDLHVVDTTDDAVYGPFLDGRLGSDGGGRFDVAVTPDGKTALVSNFGDRTVFLIDVTHPISPSLIASVKVPFFAEDIAISADGRYALVADNGSSRRLATIDIPAASLVYTADLGTAGAQGVAIAPDGTVIFPDYFGKSIHTLVLAETGVLTYPAGMTQPSTYTYTDLMSPINVGIAPDGQTVIVCDVATSTVGIYQIVAPGVLTFTGLVTGAHGTPYEFYDSGGGDLIYPGVQSVAFNAAGDKAYLSINNLRTNDITGTNTGDRVGILAITGPSQVHLEAGGVATVPHQTGSQLFGVDTLAIAGHKAYVGYPNAGSAWDPTTLAVVDLADESVTTTMVFTADTHIPLGVAAIPQRRLDLHQTVSEPAPAPGQLITYTLTLRGTGPEISEITLLDTLPPEVDFVGPITVFPPTAGIAGSVPPTLATHLVVSPTQPVTVTIPVRVRILPPDTVVLNTARAESFLLSLPASAPRAFTVARHLALHKTVSDPTPNPYQGLTYTLTLTNTGETDDPAVMLTDTLPAQMVFNAWVTQPTGAQAGPGGVAWNGLLTAREVLTFTFTVTQTASYDEVVVNTAAFSGMGQTGSAAVTYTVASNVAPALNVISDQATDELVTLVFTATASDANGYPPLVYSLDAGSVGALTPGGVFTWMPTEAQGPGVYTATVRVSDGALEASETFTITVAEVNTAPVLAAIGDRAVAELTLLTFTAAATDTDIPTQSLTFTLAAGSVGSITEGGIFTWTPAEVDGPGVFTATIQVSDGALVDSEIVSITVAEVNAAPILGALADRLVQLGATVSFTATASDADIPVNPLTFTLDAGSVGAVTPGGAFAWTPEAAGVYTAALRVSDGALNAAAEFTITVTPEPVYTLHIALAGDGQGTVAPGVGDHTYVSGTTALVTATAQPGSAFVGWSGAATGTANPASILMNGNKILTATFQDIRLAAFTLTAQPAAVYANGLDEVALRFTATTATGNGAPFAGRVVTVTWTHGFYASPITATLDAAGAGTARYVAGVVPGTANLTATITDESVIHTATAAVELWPNPLAGALDFVTGNELITYTFVLTNVSGGSQTGVVLTGSIPADTALVGVTGGFSVTMGGDYGWGYVTSPVEPKLHLKAGETYTVTWTVRPLNRVGDIITQAHAESDTARLRLGIVRRIYRILLPNISRNARF